MTKIESEVISREFIVTQKELKEKLGLKGDIIHIDLWAGLSPIEEDNNISKDKIEWVITTRERK